MYLTPNNLAIYSFLKPDYCGVEDCNDTFGENQVFHASICMNEVRIYWEEETEIFLKGLENEMAPQGNGSLRHGPQMCFLSIYNLPIVFNEATNRGTTEEQSNKVSR